MRKLLAFILVLAGTSFFRPAFSLAADYHGVVGIDYSQDAGNMFYCSSTGSVTTQAGVSISSPVIALYNPPGSGKNLTIIEASFIPTVTPAQVTSVFWAYNVTPSSGIGTTGAAGAVISANLVEKSTGTLTTSIAKCNLQGILPAIPVVFKFMGGVSSTTIAGLVDHTQGKVVVPPGGLVTLQTSGAITAQAHFLWREDPQ